MSTARRWIAPGTLLTTLLFAHALEGCHVPVETDVSAADAKSVVALLQAHHLGASTRQHAAAPGAPTFDVVVLQQDAAEAVALLRNSKPGNETRGATAEPVAPKTSIPTFAEEQAQVSAQTARGLERALAIWEGVINVRVQITPGGGVARPLGSPPAPSRVSVTIEHRPNAAPTLVTIRSLVSHSIPGLRPEDLFVVLLEARPKVASPLVQVGPITVTRGSAAILRIGLVTLLSLLGASAALLAWTRIRHNRKSLQD